MSSRHKDAGRKIARIPQGAHSQLEHAAERLNAFLADFARLPEKASVTVKVDAVAEAGEEGFRALSASSNEIEILANTDAGAANGIYGLLREIRIRQLDDPFAETWDLLEVPRWAYRCVTIAPFMVGLSKMTPDTWTFGDWQHYVDFIRSFNINYLLIHNLHLYHPDVPESEPNRWRFEIYRRVVDYAHRQGMKVVFLFAYNQVPAAVWWEHPELRTEAVRGYYGHAFSWLKAKDVIMKYHKYTMDFLDGLDGIVLLVSEPLGWCMSPEFIADPAGVFLDAVNTFRAAFRERNPNGDIYFGNWMLGYIQDMHGVLANWRAPQELIEKLPEIQPRLLREMPKDVVFVDLSANQMKKAVRLVSDEASYFEILEAAPKEGYKVCNFMFFMDREFGLVDHCNIFPKPFLDMTVDEFEYTKKLPVISVSSYRMAPPGRFLSDFFFMRLCWNPDIRRRSLIDEAAGYLTANAADRQKIASAIEDLEAYWQHRERDRLLKAKEAFETVTGSVPEELARIRDGLSILALVDDYARVIERLDAAGSAGKDTDLLEKARDRKLLECYDTMKRFPLYQGFTSDGFWEPRALTLLLRPRMEVWAEYINNGRYCD